jgi:hypothetical protein
MARVTFPQQVARQVSPAPGAPLATLAELLAEARVAARSLYDLHPTPESVEPLYGFLRDSLTIMDDALARLMAEHPAVDDPRHTTP